MEEDRSKKYCPLIKRECLRDQCEWWIGSGNFASCAIREIDRISLKLYKIQQALGGGAAAGGGRGRFKDGGDPMTDEFPD